LEAGSSRWTPLPLDPDVALLAKQALGMQVFEVSALKPEIPRHPRTCRGEETMRSMVEGVRRARVAKKPLRQAM
jgi:hypothetical protein